MLNSDIKKYILRLVGLTLFGIGVYISYANVKIIIAGGKPPSLYVIFCLTVIFAGILIFVIGFNATQKLKSIISMILFSGLASLPILSMVQDQKIKNPIDQVQAQPLIFVSYGIIIICLLVLFNYFVGLFYLTLRLKEMTRINEYQRYRLIFHEEGSRLFANDSMIYIYETPDVSHFQINHVYKISKSKLSKLKNAEPESISKYSKDLSKLDPLDFVLKNNTI